MSTVEWVLVMVPWVSMLGMFVMLARWRPRPQTEIDEAFVLRKWGLKRFADGTMRLQWLGTGTVEVFWGRTVIEYETRHGVVQIHGPTSNRPKLHLNREAERKNVQVLKEAKGG